MSASLVRKALDETTLASEEKLEQLSKVSSKHLKAPKKNKKKLDKDKLLKQNLNILKALDCKVGQKSRETSQYPAVSAVSKDSKKSNKKKKKQEDSVFTEEDFEKFEKEYFVS